MGCSMAYAAFEIFSTFLEWMIKDRTSCPHIMHYLVNYLFVGLGGTAACTDWLAAFQKLVKETGLPLAVEKTEGPATSLTFLGILLDTVQVTSSLSLDKLATLRCCISEMQGTENAPSGRFSSF